MKFLFPAISSLFILFAVAFKNKSVKDPDFTCVLTASKTNYEAGELPKFNVSIKNNSSKEVYLIGSLEKSDIQRRMPWCYFTVEKPKPDSFIIERCGFANPLRLQDFVKLKPGDSFDPYAVIDNYGFFPDDYIIDRRTFRNAGVYRIQFHYSTNGNNTRRFYGSMSPGEQPGQWIKMLVSKVPKIDLESNIVEISIGSSIVNNSRF